VVQSGSQCCALDLFMSTRGYDVCGERIPGRGCRCSGAWVAIRLYSCPVRMLPQCVLSLPLALCKEICNLTFGCACFWCSLGDNRYVQCEGGVGSIV
jgi:hypothetical protein